MQYGDMTRTDASVQLPVPFVGDFTRDTAIATGTQSITGVGFKPSAILFMGAQNSVVGEMALGIADGSSVFALSDRYKNTANTWIPDNILFFDGIHGVADEYRGTAVVMDSDGFTLSWTKAGSPVGTLNIGFLAFK